MENNTLNDIIKENVPRLRSYVRRRVNNQDEADDIVQDTLYQFMRTIRVLENPISHVTSWLYTVAHNLIINNGRKHREILATDYSREDDEFMNEISEILIADTNDNPDISMLRAMVWEELNKALEELPEVQRNAIILTELKGLSVKEASTQTGVSQNTFLSRKHYAVLHIRKKLHTLYNDLLNS